MSSDLLSKAQDSLAVARLAAGNGYFDSAVDRAYYAMFHAARAALFEVEPEGLLAIKTHSTVIGEFGRRLVRSGLIEEKFGRWINAAQKQRVRADYSGDAVFAASEVELIISHAAEFLDAVGTFLQGRVAGDEQ